MIFFERAIIGLWSAFTLGAVAVFTSTIPNIYAAEDSLRCGAFALTAVSLTKIEGGRLVILSAYVIFNASRLLIRLSEIRFLGSLAMIGGIFWFAMCVGGALEFSNYLYMFDYGIIGGAPELPDNKNDRSACRNLILPPP